MIKLKLLLPSVLVIASLFEFGAAYPYPYYYGWPSANSALLSPPAYNPQYNQFSQPRYQQAASRSNPAYPGMNPSYRNAYPRPKQMLYQRPAARQMPPMPYQPTPEQYNQPMSQPMAGYNAFTATPTCDMCNGDCNDWSCYGCGGCETPQMVQQAFMYPYQRQDAAFHDSFTGHEMALSGMVMWPVPKLPKALRKLNPPKARSQTYEEEADDVASGSGSGDEEDDEDDTR